KQSRFNQVAKSSRDRVGLTSRLSLPRSRLRPAAPATPPAAAGATPPAKNPCKNMRAGGKGHGHPAPGLLAPLPPLRTPLPAPRRCRRPAPPFPPSVTPPRHLRDHSLTRTQNPQNPQNAPRWRGFVNSVYIVYGSGAAIRG